MPDVPDDMKSLGRPEDPHFEADERLFRRYPPEFVDGASLAIEALELPDMSVNREKYGPPEWLVLDQRFEGWGVLGFEVRHIPAELLHQGVTRYTFSVRHRPEKNNYPHSEVWAYREDQHIDATAEFLLDADVHLRWRQQLLWKCRPVIAPERT